MIGIFVFHPGLGFLVRNTNRQGTVLQVTEAGACHPILVALDADPRLKFSLYLFPEIHGYCVIGKENTSAGIFAMAAPPPARSSREKNLATANYGSVTQTRRL